MDTPSSADRERIMSLEQELAATKQELAATKQELAATKQQLALSKCAQDSLMCELVKTNAALVKATTSKDDDPANADTARTFNISESSSLGTAKTVTTLVPTVNPFSRKETQTKKKTVLNPGSCSSAMDLLNIMSVSFNANNGDGIIRGRKSQRTTQTLNPGSCASALNLFADINLEQSQSDYFLSSFERLSSSLPPNSNSGGLSRLSRSSNTSSNKGKRNAEWGEFK